MMLIALLFVLPVACSGGFSTPTGPDTRPTPVQETQVSPPVETYGSGDHYMWGYYSVFVNPSKMTFEVIPLRQAEGHWNVLKWLEKGPCTDCFSIVDATPSGTGTLLVQIGIRHPFPSPNLTGFDVRGIAMFNGTHEFPESGLLTSDRSIDEGEIVNPDGYTTLYNPTTIGSGPDGLQGYYKGKFGTVTFPTSTLNAYKRFVSEDPSNTRNAFYSGETIIVEYEVDMPAQPFVFGYAVDANWAPPTVKPVTDPMTDFPPDANCPEPWKIYVSVEPIGAGLHSLGGSAKLTIDVYDWQGKDSHSDPVVECPELFDGTVIAALKSDATGYATFEAVVENTKPAQAGSYRCLVKVEDDANQTAPDWLDLTAYQVVMLDVSDKNPPVAAATADPETQTVCESINFDDDGSYDPDGGAIQSYEWDWDNDGTFDEEGNHVSHSWDEIGTYEVQFRVTDDEASTDVLDEPLTIEVQNALPTAAATVYHFPPGQPVTVKTVLQFDGSTSADNDCLGLEITNWEWDWENDGAFDDVGETQNHTYNEIGHYEVQLRVTDDEGGTDLLDEPIEIDVVDFGWAFVIGTPVGGTLCYDVASDQYGNLYVVGSTWYDADFDPGPGTTEPSEKGIFIASYTSAGDYRWAYSWSTAGSPDEADGVAVDNQGPGYVYLTGSFAGLHDFDPGPGVDNHTPDGARDAFLLKFDLDGLYQWGKHWGHSGYEYGRGVAVGGDSKVYVCGSFEGSVDFDPSNGYTEWRTATGIRDSYLSAFDSSGSFLWVNAWGGTDADPYLETAYGTAADDYGNVYVTGAFMGTADFDPGPNTHNLTSSGDCDGYLAHYAASGGNYMWAYAISSTSDYDRGNRVTVDDSGMVYLTGNFDNTVDFDFLTGTTNKTAIGWEDAFVAKYTFNAVLQWIVTWGGMTGSGYTHGLDLDVSPNGKVTVGGTFEETVDFDPGIAHSDWTSNGQEDVFIVRLANDGTFEWAGAWGGTDRDSRYALGVASDSLDNAYIGGFFFGTVDFDPSDDVLNLESPSDYEATFVSKFLPDGSW